MLLQGDTHSMVEVLVLFSEIMLLVLDVKQDSETAGTILHITIVAILRMLVFIASS